MWLQFGVFQKGFTVTPSDLIELIAFERDPKYLLSTTDSPASRSGFSRSGVILSTPQGGEVRVGLDYSNDIIRVDSRHLHTLFDRITSRPS